MQFEIPKTLSKIHEQALAAYLARTQNLSQDAWPHLYQAINLLDNAQIITDDSRQTFRQAYDK